ncbi:tyrosine-type recombinase/integrase [Cellvibrio sp. UBA7671]|uniref:tyrosine-type recombinase/integrase n=1 Tax=Cellvibrio sp. UBA7671 TaxID=1946312 RepID=UPI002F36070D
MYLLENSTRWTGKTVVTVAAKLSELVRYCSAYGRGFSELDDMDLSVLISNLCSETNPESQQRVRNNNSVRSIIYSVLGFLVWFQENLNFSNRPLIGTKPSGASIIIEYKKTGRRGEKFLHHRYLPPSNSTDRKLPISTDTIEKIQLQIEILYESEAYPEPARRRFGKNKDLFDGYREYITARREFMIFAMRRTGMRPQELCDMSVAKNKVSLNGVNPFLVLPTLKRRRNDPPERFFPVSEGDAVRFNAYFTARDDWYQLCRLTNPGLEDDGAMFLSTEPKSLGTAISKSGLEKDFSKLCERAGLQNVQSCFSMFRHRFITDLVILYLKEWRAQQGQMAKQDYRMLLEKVREKTGHKSVESLWHYIDLALSMEGVWDPINRAAKRLDACESLRHDLVDLKRKLKSEKGGGTDSEAINFAIARLESIIEERRLTIKI